MTSSSTLPPPFIFGFDPVKFPGWRPGQDAALLQVLNDPKRISVQCLPTGKGKSLLGVAAASLNGARTVYLTRRKGLQGQMLRDFDPKPGIHDVRGQSAYVCRLTPSVNVDVGPCHGGAPCQYRNGGCGYYDAVAEAKRPETMLTVTNYAFWFSQAKYTEKGLGEIDFLICDEGHGVLDELSSFLQIEIQRAEIERLGLTWPEDQGKEVGPWSAWARSVRAVCEAALQTLQQGGQKSTPAEVRERRRLESLVTRIKDLQYAQGRWVCELSARQGTLKASPIWPGEYLEEYLFQGAKKVLFLSATIRPKTMHLLGLKDEDFSFNEVQSDFPLDRRMVWCVDAPRMNHRADAGDHGIWLDRIDAILAKRLDRKIIIHTGSYDRRTAITTQSRYAGYMLKHSAQDVERVIEQFKDADPPAILVSQSLTEGYDFPYADCEAQLIVKIPYPDTRDPLVKARHDDDKSYTSYIAMQAVVQACGRASRAADDFCENFIVDGNNRWFFKQNAQYAPQWFNRSISQIVTPPDPPPPFSQGGKPMVSQDPYRYNR